MPKRLPPALSASQSHDPDENNGAARSSRRGRRGATERNHSSGSRVGLTGFVGALRYFPEGVMNRRRIIASSMCAGLLALVLIGGTATTANAHARVFLGLSAPVYFPPPYYRPYYPYPVYAPYPDD